MVATGDVRSFSQRVNVDGVGSGQWDGWQIVGRYPASLLESGAGHYAFLVRGIVGEVQPVTGTPIFAVIEITIADAAPSGGGINRICTSHIVRLPATPSAMGRFQEGIPFGFAAVFDTTVRQPGLRVDPDIGSTWPARDLLVIARVFLNGDPASVAVRFNVADLWVMHWDLQRVPTTHAVVYDHAPAAPDVITETPAVVASQYLPPQAQAGTWLYFHWIRYVPTAANNAARFQVLYQEDGGPQFPILGIGRMGHGRRGLVVSQNDLSTLVFRPVPRLPGVGLTLSLLGAAGQPSVTGRTELFRWRVLGIRLDPGVTCSYPEVFYEDSEPVLARPAGDLTAWLWERSRADLVANLVAIFQASPGWLQPQDSTHDAYLTDDTYQPFRSPAIHAVARGPWGEGQHSLVVARRPRRNSDFRWRLHMWQIPATPALPFADCFDLAAAEWTFENDPKNVPLIGPQPPAPLQLVPAREALAANYLPIPPHDIYDANGWSEEPVDNQARFEADSGLMRTWPVFIGVKSVWSFTRSGLTRTQRDELLAFFKTNTNFRVRLPRRKADTACKVIDRPSVDDGGGVYTLSLRAVELIHIGGLP